MAETKDSIAADRDKLAAENAQLKARLAALGQPSGYAPAQTFQLSEGARQELETYGYANIGGRTYTRDEVLDKLTGDQAGVEIGEPDPALDRSAAIVAGRRGAVEGVDFIYPSVAPGQIDPAVAGTPGINGPAADPATVTDDVTARTEEV